jgi:hydrogenase expression/formation protein HypC
MCLAVPGKILTVRGEDVVARAARVDFGGVVKEISLAYTPDARPGEYVLVHVGFAMTVIDEAEARRMLNELREIAEQSGLSAGEAA